jgi:hypothetical protein
MLNPEAIIGLVIVGVATLAAGAAMVTCIRNTKGPKEHRYVVLNCAMAWAAILLLFLAMYVLPSPWQYIPLVFYFIHLPIATYRFSQKQQLIRRLESIEAAEFHAGHGI